MPTLKVNQSFINWDMWDTW